MIPLDCLPIYEDAEFYDLEFAERTYEIPYFSAMALQAAGPVLEVACGTGRITLPLAKQGVDITGLDVSPAMIARARQNGARAGLPVEWIEQDCRDMRLGRSYALIFSATNAMQHLLDIDSACSFLRSARAALQPGGRLVIDVFNPSLEKLLKTPADRHVLKTIPHATTPITVEVSSHYLADTQILHFDLFYLRAGQVERTKHVNMRVFYPQELLALCQFSGLRMVERHGDYVGSSFTGASSKQILICQSA
jgi:2-polyprenyl-3-methyl-5-hydroxy-6-metoxy-1,4-benzoquinol methylase